MSSPVLGMQHYIRLGKSMLLQMMNSKDKSPELRAVLKHARHRNIKFVQRGGHKTFVMSGNVIMDGLTKRLKGTVWSSSTAPKVREGKVPDQATANVGGCYFRGISWKHGRKVHGDFARIVKCLTNQTTMRKGGSMNVGKVDACAFRLFITLIQKKIVPIICEMAIYDEYLRIATAIDCIAYDTIHHRVIAIEIKTGHLTQRDYSAHNKKSSLMAPLRNVPDTPLNRAGIQLLVSLLMVKRRYGIHIHDGMVLRPFGQSGIAQKYKLPEWMFSPGYQHAILHALRKDIEKKKRNAHFQYSRVRTTSIRVPQTTGGAEG